MQLHIVPPRDRNPEEVVNSSLASEIPAPVSEYGEYTPADEKFLELLKTPLGKLFAEAVEHGFDGEASPRGLRVFVKSRVGVDNPGWLRGADLDGLEYELESFLSAVQD